MLNLKTRWIDLVADLDMAEEKISKLEARAEKMIYNVIQKDKTRPV